MMPSNNSKKLKVTGKPSSPKKMPIEREPAEVTSSEDSESAEKTMKNLSISDWVKKALDEKSYPLFQWCDRKKGVFQLPWAHRTSNKWNEHIDLAVPIAWAQYKDNYSESKLHTLKARFRCALNSRKELLELPDLKTKKFRYWAFAMTQERHEKVRKSEKNNAKNKKQPASMKTINPTQAVESAPVEIELQSVPDASRVIAYLELPPFDQLRHGLPPAPHFLDNESANPVSINFYPNVFTNNENAQENSLTDMPPLEPINIHDMDACAPTAEHTMQLDSYQNIMENTPLYSTCDFVETTDPTYLLVKDPSFQQPYFAPQHFTQQGPSLGESYVQQLPSNCEGLSILDTFSVLDDSHFLIQNDYV